MSQRNSHTHCQSPTSQRLDQSLAKECACPTQEEKLKISSPSKNKKYSIAQADKFRHKINLKMIDKTKNINGLQGQKIKRQLVTKCINHWAESAGFKHIAFNQICGGLTGKCFEMPNASYTNRYALLKHDI